MVSSKNDFIDKLIYSGPAENAEFQDGFEEFQDTKLFPITLRQLQIIRIM